MNTQERCALEELINYNWADEEEDFDHQAPEGREGHIFHSLKILKAYLEYTRSRGQ